MARGLKFRIHVVEGLYYPYSENKGADQLRSDCAADLRLCFRICKKRFSHNEAQLLSLYVYNQIIIYTEVNIDMWFYGVMVSTLDFESSDPSSNLGRTYYFINRYSISLVSYRMGYVSGFDFKYNYFIISTFLFTLQCFE